LREWPPKAPALARLEGSESFEIPILSYCLCGLVVGGRFELYSAYPIRVPAVPASVFATR